MNLESLSSDPARLMSILFNRVKYTPEQWAPYDNYLLDKPWNIGAFSIMYNGNCIVMHSSNYGKLVGWEEKAAHAWDMVGFPRGILVLEAQTKLSDFLRAIVAKLSENSEEGQGLRGLSEALELCLKKETGNSGCVEFTSAHLSQPFSSPPIFDIDMWLSLAQTQVNSRADHLWLMQTDPGSLRRYSALVLDGAFKENLTTQNQHAVVAHQLMKDATIFWSWEWVLEEVQGIKRLHTKYQDRICRGKPLPEPYERSIGCLEALLFNIIKRRSRDAAWLLPTCRTCRGLRDKWTVEFIEGSRIDDSIASGMWMPRRKEKLYAEVFFQDRLDFCLSALAAMLLTPAPGTKISGGQERYYYHEPSELFAILDEHLLTCKREDAARMDEIVYNVYSNLSASHYLFSLVRLHLPRISGYTIEQAAKTETGKAWRYVRAGYLDEEQKHSDNPSSSKHNEHTIGYLLGKFLETPVPRGSRATQKWLDQDESQRAACVQFWAQMRNRHRKFLERLSIGADDIESDLKVLSADQSPEHIAAVQDERAKILARIAAKNGRNASRQSPVKSDLQTQWGSDDQERTPKQEPKVKTKTSPDKQDSKIDLTLEDLNLSDQDSVPPPQVKVAVRKRTLEILQSLFPNPNFEERTKSIDWASFVYAMADVGFAVKHTDGSEYAFEPVPTSKWFGNGKIVFHKPHPVPKYEAGRFLSVGKRMNKWFGWSAETFELLEKK